MNLKTTCLLVVVVGLFMAGGCDRVGTIDPTILNRYQQSMTRQGEDARKSSAGLGLLRSTDRSHVPALKLAPTSQPGRLQIPLSLDQTVMRALANNLDIRVLSYDPAISHEQVIQADAVFDPIIFGGYAFSYQDEPSNRILVQQGAVHQHQYQVGVKQTTITGAQYQIATSLTRTETNLPVPGPNPAWGPALTAQLTQPLLRNGWPAYNLAQFQIAQINYRNSVSTFRQQVQQTVSDVINGYWLLVDARRARDIQKALLDVTIETLRRVRARAELDATAVEIKQAEAAVEVRRATLYTAEKAIGDAQDSLAKLLGDPQINLVDHYELLPVTPMAVAPIRLSAEDQMVTALALSPLLEQARLAIQTADVNIVVARNQALPKLDLSANYGINGQGSNFSNGYDNWSRFDFQSYGISVQGEYPLGNRAAEAGVRLSGYQRLKAVATLQNTADRVATQVRERVRGVEISLQQVQAQHAAVDASKIQLQALDDTERIRGRLTPEFLQVKLQAQSLLADAQRAESRAIFDYNAALVDLTRITGTILEQQRVQIALPAALGETPWPAGEDFATPKITRTTAPATK